MWRSLNACPIQYPTYKTSEIIDLKSKKLEFFNQVKKNPKNLDIKLINCSNNAITSLDKSFLHKYPNLEVFNFANNQITKLEFFDIHKNLQFLDFSENNIPLIENLEDNQELTQIIAFSNKIHSIFLKYNLPKLVYLDLRSNPLNKLTFGTRMPALKILLVSNCQLTEMPDFVSFPNLEFLDISRNKLETAQSIKQNNLIVLNISRNQITDLSTFNSFKKLERLDISFNEIEDDGFRKAKKLKSLKLLYARSTRLKKIQILTHISPNITELDLSFTKIDQFDDVLSYIKSNSQLRALDLRGTEVTQHMYPLQAYDTLIESISMFNSYHPDTITNRQSYRQQIIDRLPTLEVLDGIFITAADRNGHTEAVLSDVDSSDIQISPENSDITKNVDFTNMETNTFINETKEVEVSAVPEMKDAEIGVDYCRFLEDKETLVKDQMQFCSIQKHENIFIEKPKIPLTFVNQDPIFIYTKPEFSIDNEVEMEIQPKIYEFKLEFPEHFSISPDRNEIDIQATVEHNDAEVIAKAECNDVEVLAKDEIVDKENSGMSLKEDLSIDNLVEHEIHCIECIDAENSPISLSDQSYQVDDEEENSDEYDAELLEENLNDREFRGEIDSEEEEIIQRKSNSKKSQRKSTASTKKEDDLLNSNSSAEENQCKSKHSSRRSSNQQKSDVSQRRSSRKGDNLDSYDEDHQEEEVERSKHSSRRSSKASQQKSNISKRKSSKASRKEDDEIEIDYPNEEKSKHSSRRSSKASARKGEDILDSISSDEENQSKSKHSSRKSSTASKRKSSIGQVVDEKSSRRKSSNYQGNEYLQSDDSIQEEVNEKPSKKSLRKSSISQSKRSASEKDRRKSSVVPNAKDDDSLVKVSSPKQRRQTTAVRKHSAPNISNLKLKNKSQSKIKNRVHSDNDYSSEFKKTYSNDNFSDYYSDIENLPSKRMHRPTAIDDDFTPFEFEEHSSPKPMLHVKYTKEMRLRDEETIRRLKEENESFRRRIEILKMMQNRRNSPSYDRQKTHSHRHHHRIDYKFVKTSSESTESNKLYDSHIEHLISKRNHEKFDENLNEVKHKVRKLSNAQSNNIKSEQNYMYRQIEEVENSAKQQIYEDFSQEQSKKNIEKSSQKHKIYEDKSQEKSTRNVEKVSHKQRRDSEKVFTKEEKSQTADKHKEKSNVNKEISIHSHAHQHSSRKRSEEKRNEEVPNNINQNHDRHVHKSEKSPQNDLDEISKAKHTHHKATHQTEKVESHRNTKHRSDNDKNRQEEFAHRIDAIEKATNEMNAKITGLKKILKETNKCQKNIVINVK